MRNTKYTRVIKTHHKLFEQGNSFTAKKLLTIAGRKYTPKSAIKSFDHYEKQQSALRSIYTSLNRTLANEGKYIKASNYYKKFTVLTKVQTKQQVAVYVDRSIADENRAQTLQSGITNSN